MKKILITCALALLVLAPVTSRADEGMWLLSLIGKNYADMQKAGFKLTPEDIYSINQSCIKDAVVGLGEDGSPFWHFCTGEIISTKGLITTNYHCGHSKIQNHSTVEHDYLRDGFWAYNMQQELPNPGLTASILIRMEDVTDRVTEYLSDDMSEDDRAKAVRNVSERIANEAVKGTDYDAAVIPMFEGNQYFLFVHVIYKDVRLVGAPPSSMGKFGGDVDNWQWPRHTCDFSMFRIYTAPDGKPAPYAKENIPLKPKHHLPVSIREVKEGDFAMVLGFPGTTDHFITSYGLKEKMEVDNEITYNVRDNKIRTLRISMRRDPVVNLKYSAKYAESSNAWKYSGEQNKALKKLGTMEIKKQIEREYLEWAKDKDPKYRKALEILDNAYSERREKQEAIVYIWEGLLQGPEILYQANIFRRQIKAICEEGNEARREAMIEALNEEAAAFYRDYDEALERRICANLMLYTYEHINVKYVPDCLKTADRKFKGDFVAWTNNIFAHSIFANKENFDNFMKNPSMKIMDRDPLLKVGREIYLKRRELQNDIPQSNYDDLSRGNRDFVDGILQINAGKRLMSPDANSTIRLTYGNVKAYDPSNGVTFHYYTTLDGVMQKEDPKSSEFIVPQRLKDLYAEKDYGPYANSKGDLPTCFITNNDITGGNSGSPVLDAYGNLIGLAFDGNSEAMSGDVDFEENLQRCICLDTRYMLFVIDKYANAQNLIEEMDIVR